jgi:hypothetical protein
MIHGYFDRSQFIGHKSKMKMKPEIQSSATMRSQRLVEKIGLRVASALPIQAEKNIMGCINYQREMFHCLRFP